MKNCPHGFAIKSNNQGANENTKIQSEKGIGRPQNQKSQKLNEKRKLKQFLKILFFSFIGIISYVSLLIQNFYLMVASSRFTFSFFLLFVCFFTFYEHKNH